MKRKLTQRLTVLLGLFALWGTASCARVKPYQREHHASRAMTDDKDKSEEKMDGHVREYREGSIGGAGVGGGGCGCN